MERVLRDAECFDAEFGVGCYCGGVEYLRWIRGWLRESKITVFGGSSALSGIGLYLLRQAWTRAGLLAILPLHSVTENGVTKIENQLRVNERCNTCSNPAL